MKFNTRKLGKNAKGIYLIKYDKDGEYEILNIYHGFSSDYPYCKTTIPIEDIAKFSWKKLE